MNIFIIINLTSSLILYKLSFRFPNFSLEYCTHCDSINSLIKTLNRFPFNFWTNTNSSNVFVSLHLRSNVYSSLWYLFFLFQWMYIIFGYPFTQSRQKTKRGTPRGSGQAYIIDSKQSREKWFRSLSSENGAAVVIPATTPWSIRRDACPDDA